MRIHDRVQGAARTAYRRLQYAAGALATGVATVGARVAYRRREIAVLALLSASLLGGFAFERWRERAPATLERLEAEPPRFAAAARFAAPRAAARHAERAGDPRRAPAEPRALPPTAAGPLDLNRATAAELTRLPGIGPRLAERILARRDALGGQFRTLDDLATVPGLGRRKAGAVTPLVTVGTAAGGAGALGNPAETSEARP